MATQGPNGISGKVRLTRLDDEGQPIEGSTVEFDVVDGHGSGWLEAKEYFYNIREPAGDEELQVDSEGARILREFKGLG
jgi:hypothetical protein